ncbi:MAG: hypothetical protein AAFX87_31855, partial [Bacteroidota bacterium]
ALHSLNFYIATISFLAGFVGIKLFCQKLQIEAPKNFSILSVCGLVFICILTSLASFFFKVDVKLNLTLTILILAGSIYYFRSLKRMLTEYIRNIRWVEVVLVIVFLSSTFLVLFKNFRPTSNYDEGLYYIQSVKWLQSYPVVPGLANLHTRLGFNSNLYVLSAFFSSPFPNVPLNDINGYLYLLALLYAFSGISKLIKGENSLANYAKALFLVPVSIPDLTFFSIDSNIYLNTFNTDFFASIIVWITLISLLEKTDYHRFEISDYLVLSFSVFVVTIKLSVLPIMVAPVLLYLLQYRQLSKSNILSSVVPVVLIMLPWLIRNIITSGYLVFPLYQIDLFNFDWEVPKEHVKGAADAIEIWAYGFRGLDFPKEIDFFLHWLNRWSFSNLALIYLSAINFVILTAILFYNVIRWKSFKDKLNLSVLLAYAVTIFGIIFWALKAPNLRFGYGMIIFFNILSLSLLCFSLIRPYFRYLAIVVIVFFTYFNLIHQTKTLEKTHSEFFDALPAFKVPEIEEYEIQNGTVLVPAKADQCFNAPLPCGPKNEVSKRQIILRGQSLSSGFKSKLNSTK